MLTYLPTPGAALLKPLGLRAEQHLMCFPLTALTDDSEVGMLRRVEGPSSGCEQRPVCYEVSLTDLLSP